MRADLPVGVTPRVERLVRRSPRDPDASCWRSAYAGREAFHEAWTAAADAPLQVRVARAQAAWWASVVPAICPDQLVIGTPPPRAVVTYATGPFEWDFSIDEALAREHPGTAAEVASWREFLARRGRPSLPAGYGGRDFGSTLWASSVGCHSTQDFRLAMDGGLDGLRERARAGAANAGEDRRAWFGAVQIAIDGAAAYMRVHADAVDRAGAMPDAAPGRRSELGAIAAGVRSIADGRAPRSFLEAAHLFWFLFALVAHDSPGRMDQFLWPPLERDLASGALGIESAQEQVDCLYLKLAEHLCFGATIGGQLPSGGDATNTLTWLSLNSVKRLRLLSPRTALRWHRGTPGELLEAAAESVASGATYPTLVNDEVACRALECRGLVPEHARDYTFCGCGQVVPTGRSFGSFEDLILNGLKPLTLALHRGADELTGASLGVDTGPLDELDTYEKLEDAVWQQLVHVLGLGIAADRAHKAWAASRLPDPLRSALTHACLERGRDWRDGGAEYHLGMVDVVGFTSLADALTAVRRVVYERRHASLGELAAALDADWRGRERLRAECRTGSPKFGNGDPDADGTLARWMARVNAFLAGQRTLFGGPWGIDVIGWTGAVVLGERTGATPDGRSRGEPLADSGGPAQGRDTRGVTAVLESMRALPLTGTHGPVALNLRLPASAVAGEAGLRNLAALLAGYMMQGGSQVQVTIASAAEMRAAQADPASHRDLMVRVGGFSAYFTDLDRRFQDDMIRRTEHAVPNGGLRSSSASMHRAQRLA